MENIKRNSELRSMALKSLTGNWGIAIAVFFVTGLLLGIGGGISALILGGPILLGRAYFALDIARKKETNFERAFDGFKEFGKALGTYLLVVLFTLLWLLLFIIPGIIKSIAYSQTFFLLADDPSLGSEEAIDKSMAMMDGYKWDYFFLILSFIGWAILCIFTFGIGFFWLIPYINISLANFYQELRGDEPLQLEEADIIVETL